VPIESSKFTLPYLGYTDMIVLSDQPEKKHYGADIKTVRLSNNHYERVEDTESFHSEMDGSFKTVDVQAKIA
jgi:hypothetical protein